MEVKVKSITLLVGSMGADEAILTLNLPASTFPFDGNASVKLLIAKGQGEKYIKDHFPSIVCKVVSI